MHKTLIGTYPSPQGHWVGDGFPVRSLFSYDNLGQQLSPFLLLDYAGPAVFPPGLKSRGVGEHPHRGFETVSIVYKGEVAHRDSVGNSGLIGPGDVQWMTAAAGILHEEFHSPGFTKAGGALEMVQLWVNLPARHKMTAPRYQTLLSAAIPTIELADGAGTVRVIAGEYAGRAGPADTFSAINVWDVGMSAHSYSTFALPAGHTSCIALLRGSIVVNGTHRAAGPKLLVFDRSGDDITIAAETAAAFLVLSGEPLGEPIVGHGPFVMNSREEIDIAMNDFRSGKFGRMPALRTSLTEGA